MLLGPCNGAEVTVMVRLSLSVQMRLRLTDARRTLRMDRVRANITTERVRENLPVGLKMFYDEV